MIEILSARKYYKRRNATGTVVLVNGHPTHFTGRRCYAVALLFAAKMKNSRASS